MVASTFKKNLSPILKKKSVLIWVLNKQRCLRLRLLFRWLWDREDLFYTTILDPNKSFLFVARFSMLISIFLLLESLDIRKFVPTAWSDILNFSNKRHCLFRNFWNIGKQISIFRVEVIMQFLGERFLVRMLAQLLALHIS